jgi:hypothetical protein
MRRTAGLQEMKIARTYIPALSALLLLAGCSTTTHHRELRLSRPQALALARAVNLHAGDAPGFTAAIGAERETTFTPGSTSVHEAECEGGSDPRLMVLDRESPWFSTAGSRAISSVQVWPSAALAKRAAAAENSAEPTACVSREERREKEAAEADSSVDPYFYIQGGDRTFSKLSFPLDDVADSYGTRTLDSNRSITYLDGQHLNDRADRLAFVVGPVVVGLYALNESPALERNLLALLLKRARARVR